MIKFVEKYHACVLKVIVSTGEITLFRDLTETKWFYIDFKPNAT